MTRPDPKDPQINPWRLLATSKPDVGVDVELCGFGRATEDHWEAFEITHWRPVVVPKPEVKDKDEITESYKGYLIHATIRKATITDEICKPAVVHELSCPNNAISCPLTFVSRCRTLIDEWTKPKQDTANA